MSVQANRIPAAPSIASSFGSDAEWVLEALDLGVLVASAELRQVLWANRAARSALVALGDAEALPEAVRFALGGTIAVQSASGQRYYVRVKALPGDPTRVLLLINPAVVRERDLNEILYQRFALSLRERQLVNLLRQGMSNQQIAHALGLTVATVKSYFTNIFVAVGVASRNELVAVVDQLAAPA